MSRVRRVALVPDRSRVRAAEGARVAAALATQVARDFAPVWNLRATVTPFARLEDVPLGHWPVIVRDEVGDAEGYHDDADGRPFALVEHGRGWSLTASHEVLEMLADPFGRRMIDGPSPVRGQGRVRFLVEVCDPCGAAEFGYRVDGALVSDFYTPAYFAPRRAAGRRYSHTGAIRGPRQVLRGGLLSWKHPPSRHWFQLRRIGARTEIVDLGIKTGPESIRSWIRARKPGRGRG
jgi:hypothetical protein